MKTHRARICWHFTYFQSILIFEIVSTYFLMVQLHSTGDIGAESVIKRKMY